jgi:hypothetical protein
MEHVAVFSRHQEDGNIVAAELGDALPHWLTGEKPWDDYRLVLVAGSLRLISHEQLPDHELATATASATDGVEGLFMGLQLLASRALDTPKPARAAAASAGAGGDGGLQDTALQDLFASGLRSRRAEALSSQSRVLCLLPARLASAFNQGSGARRCLAAMAGLRFLGLDTLELRRAVAGRSRPSAAPTLQSLYNQGLSAVVCTLPSPVQAALARHAWSPVRSVRLTTERALAGVSGSAEQAQARAAAQIGWRLSAGFLSLYECASGGASQPEWLAAQASLAAASLDHAEGRVDADPAVISGLEACLSEAAESAASIDAAKPPLAGSSDAGAAAEVADVAGAVASALPAFVERQGGMQHVQVSSGADSESIEAWEAFLQETGPAPETMWDGGDGSEWVWPEAMQPAMASGVCNDAALAVIERAIRLEPLHGDDDLAGVEAASTAEMDAMDAEVAASATLGGSFGGDTPGGDDMPRAEEEQQLNMLASLLQSLEGQDGSSGPASALLGQLGISNPLEWAEQARQLAENGTE